MGITDNSALCWSLHVITHTGSIVLTVWVGTADRFNGWVFMFFLFSIFLSSSTQNLLLRGRLMVTKKVKNVNYLPCWIDVIFGSLSGCWNMLATIHWLTSWLAGKLGGWYSWLAWFVWWSVDRSLDSRVAAFFWLTSISFVVSDEDELAGVEHMATVCCWRPAWPEGPKRVSVQAASSLPMIGWLADMPH